MLERSTSYKNILILIRRFLIRISRLSSIKVSINIIFLNIVKAKSILYIILLLKYNIFLDNYFIP